MSSTTLTVDEILTLIKTTRNLYVHDCTEECDKFGCLSTKLLLDDFVKDFVELVNAKVTS